MKHDPDYRRMVQVLQNEKPDILPLYEHIIDARVVARMRGVDITLSDSRPATLRHHYGHVCVFWRDMTYDTISFEGCITPVLVDGGALYGGKQGPIQSWEDLESYPFDTVEKNYWECWAPHLDVLGESIPDGMRLIGGCGNGVFEILQDLVGFESVSVMMYDDPELVDAILERIRTLMDRLWTRMLRDYGDLFCIGRIGDDLGFKTSTMVSPDAIRRLFIPVHRHLIAKVHDAGKPFLMHSCGCIFPVMDDLIAAGINAKHSNEDQIAPYSEWIDRYGGRIGLVGGVDVDRLCQTPPETLREEIIAEATEHRRRARGYALGSGNSIADYVPTEGYLAMIDAAKEIRRREREG